MYKFAVIGCGRIAPRHIENIEKVGRLIAVCDIVHEKANLLAAKYNVKAYYSIDDLLREEKDIDVISVCTPNGYHAEHSIKSLQSGKHVLCEKPMCLTSAAAWQMIETEKFSRRKLFVVKSTRFNPLLIKLKKALDSGVLGEIYNFKLCCFWNRPVEYYRDWRGKTFPDGGTLYTQFSHYIDAMLWLFGTIETVKGFANNFAHKNIIEFEDTGVAVLKMKSGSLGSIDWSVNSFQKNNEISLTVIAEKATISFGGEYLNELRYQQSEQAIDFGFDNTGANDYGFYKGSMSNHKEVYENLIESLNNDRHPFTNAFDGLRTVEAIEQIYKAVNHTSTH